MKRIIAFLLALLMLTPAFIACDKGEDTPDTTEGAPSSEPEDTGASSAANSIKVTQGGKGLFTIIRPDESSTTVYNLTKDLGEDLKAATGADFTLDTDFKSWSTVRDPEKYEILIGNTNYDETLAVLGEIKYFDYAIVIRGKKLIIAAYTEQSLRKAMTYFNNNILPLIAKDADGDFALSFEDFFFRSNYSVDSLTLDGTPIEKYVVVYGKDTPAGATIAQSVVDVFASATGIYLPIMSDKEAETEFEILAGKTNRSVSSGIADLPNLGYKVSLRSGKLVIECHSAETGDAAVRKLYASKMSGGGNVALTSGDLCEGTLLTEPEMPMTAGSDIRIVTYNVLTKKWGGTETSARAEYFGAFLDVYKPDIVGVQEVCDKWRKYLPERIGTYKLIGTTRKDGGQSYSAIVYDTAKYDVLAQGVETYSYHASSECRNMSWAIFVNKATGVKFAFISTHWDFGDEEEKQQMRKVQADEMSKKIADLKAEYGCPVIITGDFNCNNNSDSYKYFMSINGMTNAITSSEYYYNAKGTTTIDFIMITTGDGVFKGYRKLVDNGIAQISDHPANLADIDLLP